MQKKIYEYFPHPVFYYKLLNFEEHNKELEKYIYQLQKDDLKGVQKSNINGWHSKYFDLSKNDAPGQKLALNTQPYIMDVFKAYGWEYNPQKIAFTGMWAVVNKKGNFNIEHTHPNSHLSAAYYVKVPKNSGKFKITNPHMISRDRFPQRVKPTELNRLAATFEISEGDLIIFPSYLPHSVLPNETDEDRIVVSFNLYIHR